MRSPRIGCQPKDLRRLLALAAVLLDKYAMDLSRPDPARAER